MTESNREDVLYPLPSGAVQLEGIFDEAIRLVTEETLKKLNYRCLADYFRYQLDEFATGEFWGKLVRAGSMIYRYSQDAELKAILDRTVDDMLSIQGEDGCISTVPAAVQPNGTHGSDLWERKYVLLGLLSYYEISGREDVLRAMKGAADYTISQVGEPPKTPITETGWAFEGIESSSILEPVVRLYHLTREPRYLEFASYIVNSGACRRENLFEAIYAGKDPKDIGNNGNPKESIAKAYEMMSCFEGLVEYYRATGIEKWKETALRFYTKLIEQEITLLGSGGADAPFNLGPGTGEQWNATRREQTNPDIQLMMETCVTVTWMKLCYQLLRLTGDASIADQIETSAYNALLGAIRPDGRFFEYFPRFHGVRNPKVNYSFPIDGFDLSCCTANGPSGLGLIPLMAFLNSKKGPVISLYITGSASFPLSDGGSVSIRTKSNYPAEGSLEVLLTQVSSSSPFAIQLRIPSWCHSYRICVNGEAVKSSGTGGQYAAITRNWRQGDRLSLELLLPLRLFDAPHGSSRLGDPFVALMRGPILLTRDARSGESAEGTVSFHRFAKKEASPRYDLDCTGRIPCQLVSPSFPCWLQVEVETDDGPITMIDYRSAGATWDATSAFCSWLPTK